jgi:ABC-2 type transport system ATP-binding protein
MLLKIDKLKKTYFHKGKPVTHALQGIDLEIVRGEVFSLLGVNGAGKTTLSSIIASLHPPTEGDILWNGTSIYKNILEYRKIIGFCPQKPNLDRTFTLEENLMFAGRCYGLSLKEATLQKDKLIDQFQLKNYSASFVDFLSGGYKQRFLIARALMHHPKLVILDEPTVGLDAHIRREIWEIIKDLRKEGVTILLTTHYLDEAEVLSNRVCIIDKGLIRLIDTPERLKANYQKGNLEDVFIQLTQEEGKNE